MKKIRLKLNAYSAVECSVGRQLHSLRGGRLAAAPRERNTPTAPHSSGPTTTVSSEAITIHCTVAFMWLPQTEFVQEIRPARRRLQPLQGFLLPAARIPRLSR